MIDPKVSEFLDWYFSQKQFDWSDDKLYREIDRWESLAKYLEQVVKMKNLVTKKEI